MTIVATITAEDGTVLSLEKFLTPDGRIPDVAQVVEEELIANGVDGRRYRDISSRYPEFSAQTLETAATYAAAVTRCRAYDRLKTKNVKMAVSIGGTSYSYPRVHVKSALAIPVPGAVAGSTSGAAHAAHIVCSWSLVVMDVVQGQNP